MSLQALNTGATGMIGQSRNLDVIANNLANVSTDGFKRTRANFEDLLYKIVRLPGTGQQGDQATPSQGLQFGVGTRVSATQLSFEQGTIRSTNRPLDIAIIGRGFLRIDDGQGNDLFTRAGNLTLNSEGQVIMATATQGFLVQPPVTVPPDSTAIAISSDGQVFVTQVGNPAPQQVGQLDAVRFQNAEGLELKGNNLFAETGASGPPDVGVWTQDGFGVINQSFLESSNVEPVQELIRLITSQRAFELNSQVIQTSNENLQTVGRLRRG